MTPKCGRIDVKYANFSYHTRIGLGKWTHDPTLTTMLDAKLLTWGRGPTLRYKTRQSRRIAGSIWGRVFTIRELMFHCCTTRRMIR